MTTRQDKNKLRGFIHVTESDINALPAQIVSTADSSSTPNGYKQAGRGKRNKQYAPKQRVAKEVMTVAPTEPEPYARKRSGNKSNQPMVYAPALPRTTTLLTPTSPPTSPPFPFSSSPPSSPSPPSTLVARDITGTRISTASLFANESRRLTATPQQLLSWDCFSSNTTQTNPTPSTTNPTTNPTPNKLPNTVSQSGITSLSSSVSGYIASALESATLDSSTEPAVSSDTTPSFAPDLSIPNNEEDFISLEQEPAMKTSQFNTPGTTLALWPRKPSGAWVSQLFITWVDGGDGGGGALMLVNDAASKGSLPGRPPAPPFGVAAAGGAGGTSGSGYHSVSLALAECCTIVDPVLVAQTRLEIQINIGEGGLGGKSIAVPFSRYESSQQAEPGSAGGATSIRIVLDGQVVRTMGRADRMWCGSVPGATAAGNWGIHRTGPIAIYGVNGGASMPSDASIQQDRLTQSYVSRFVDAGPAVFGAPLSASASFHGSELQQSHIAHSALKSAARESVQWTTHNLVAGNGSIVMSRAALGQLLGCNPSPNENKSTVMIDGGANLIGLRNSASFAPLSASSIVDQRTRDACLLGGAMPRAPVSEYASDASHELLAIRGGHGGCAICAFGLPATRAALIQISIPETSSESDMEFDYRQLGYPFPLSAAAINSATFGYNEPSWIGVLKSAPMAPANATLDECHYLFRSHGLRSASVLVQEAAVATANATRAAVMRPTTAAWASGGGATGHLLQGQYRGFGGVGGAAPSLDPADLVDGANGGCGYVCIAWAESS